MGITAVRASSNMKVEKTIDDNTDMKVSLGSEDTNSEEKRASHLGNEFTVDSCSPGNGSSEVLPGGISTTSRSLEEDGIKEPNLELQKGEVTLLEPRPTTLQQQTEADCEDEDIEMPSGAFMLHGSFQDDNNEELVSGCEKPNSCLNHQILELDQSFRSSKAQDEQYTDTKFFLSLLDEDGNEQSKQDVLLDEDRNEQSQQDLLILHGSLCSDSNSEFAREGDLSQPTYTIQEDEQNNSLNVAMEQSNVFDSKTDVENYISFDKVGNSSTNHDASPEFQDFQISIIQEGPMLGDALATSLVSTEREGWQQFYSETPEDTWASGNYGELRHSHQPELWEQLLDFGLHETTKTEEDPPMDLGNENIFLQDQGWQEVLASPGNPFRDALDRLSNFSDADAFGFQEVGHARLDLGLDPGQGKEKLLSGLNGGTGLEEDQVAMVQISDPNIQSTSDAVNYQSISLQDKKRPVLVDDGGSFPEESMDVFEAPSFMSLVDPETQELVKASMPEQVKRNYAYANPASSRHADTDGSVTSDHSQSPTPLQNLDGTELKWGVFMDSLRSPQQSPTSPPQATINGSSSTRATHFLSRGVHSLSASPKLGHSSSPTGVPRSSPRRISAFSWLTPPSSPRWKHTPILSPQASPFIKKIVEKVRSTPAVASKLVSPKKNDEAKPRSIWANCICCSHVK